MEGRDVIPVIVGQYDMDFTDSTLLHEVIAERDDARASVQRDQVFASSQLDTRCVTAVFHVRCIGRGV